MKKLQAEKSCRFRVSCSRSDNRKFHFPRRCGVTERRCVGRGMKSFMHYLCCVSVYCMFYYETYTKALGDTRTLHSRHLKRIAHITQFNESQRAVRLEMHLWHSLMDRKISKGNHFDWIQFLLSQGSVSEPFKASRKTFSFKINNSVERVAQLTVELLLFGKLCLKISSQALKCKFVLCLHRISLLFVQDLWNSKSWKLSQ